MCISMCVYIMCVRVYMYMYIYACVYVYTYIYMVLFKPLVPSVYVLLYFGLFVYRDCMFHSM